VRYGPGVPRDESSHKRTRDPVALDASHVNVVGIAVVSPTRPTRPTTLISKMAVSVGNEAGNSKDITGMLLWRYIHCIEGER